MVDGDENYKLELCNNKYYNYRNKFQYYYKRGNIMSEVIEELSKILVKDINISEKEFADVIYIFNERIFGFHNINLFKKYIEYKKYKYIIENISIIYYCNKNIMQAVEDIYHDTMDKTEWIILFSKEGISLINNDVETRDTEFASGKIIFNILFGSKIGLEYLKYFSYENLSINKTTYYFKDIITYKNLMYHKKEKNWYQYNNALKSFFNYYICIGHSKRDETYSCYNEIGLHDFIGYLKNDCKIKSNNSIKNKFFYVKDFFNNMTDNTNFNVSSNTVIEFCKEQLIEKNNCLEETDADKIKNIIHYLEDRKNGTRDVLVFLFLLCYGIERRKICELKWENIDKNCNNIKINGKWVNLPDVIKKRLKILKSHTPSNAIYIITNSTTNYMTPVRVGLINDIMKGIDKIDVNDKFYKMMYPANIRKWLFRYMLKRQIPLQNILKMMNVSINNISNYVRDEELWECVTDEFRNEDETYKYLLDDFMKDIYE